MSSPNKGNANGYSRWTVPTADPLAPQVEKVESHLQAMRMSYNPEIVRRAAYLQTLPHLYEAAQEGRLNQSCFISMALSGLRSEQAHGLVGENEEYLSHRGGDPNYYLLERRPGDRKTEEFQSSLQDILDQVLFTLHSRLSLKSFLS